jgi:hypothetical protein
MGYESRVYIADVHDGKFKFVEIIACIKMSKMGCEFSRLFTDELPTQFYPIDYSDHYEDPNTGNAIEASACPIQTDSYGDTPKCTDIGTVIKFLEEFEAHEHYRRATLLLGLLKSIDPSEWQNIKVIHMGY